MELIQLKEKVATNFINLLGLPQEEMPYAVNNTEFVLEEVCNLIGVSGANFDFLLALDGIGQVVTTGIVYHWYLQDKFSFSEYIDESTRFYWKEMYFELLNSLRIQIEEAIEFATFDEESYFVDECCDCEDCWASPLEEGCTCEYSKDDEVEYMADSILCFLDALEVPRVADRLVKIASQIADSLPQI